MLCFYFNLIKRNKKLSSGIAGATATTAGASTLLGDILRFCIVVLICLSGNKLNFHNNPPILRQVSHLFLLYLMFFCLSIIILKR